MPWFVSPPPRLRSTPDLLRGSLVEVMGEDYIAQRGRKACGESRRVQARRALRRDAAGHGARLDIATLLAVPC